MIFVDTSAWFAIFVRNDRNSSTARSWLRENREQPLITTDFVIDELLTLLRSRDETELALLVGERLIGGTMARIEFVTQLDFDEAWQTFRSYRDKKWSFTDCTSRVVMRRLEIQSAFAFDEHFKQFGTAVVMP